MCDFCFLAFPTGWKLTDPWFLYDCKEIFFLFWRKEGRSVFQTEKTRGKIKRRLNQRWIYHLLSCCMQSTPCKMPVWMKHKLESRLPGEISITSDVQMTPPLRQKVNRNKEPLDEGERWEWKSWLKTQHSKNKDHGIWSHHFITNRWEDNENSQRLYILALQNHSRWWLQPCNLNTLASWKRSYYQPRQHIKKQRHYFANKGPSGQSYGFSSSHVWMWELDYKEGWVPKNWCFWTVVLGRRLLRVPWAARRPNQTILKEISPEYSLEGLMLKLNSNTLATWCEELTLWKQPWCWEWLKAGGEGDNREWDDWIASPTRWTWVSASSWSWWWTRQPGVLQSKGSQRARHNWETELNWTDNVPGT